jgi:beta-lactamase regulating signal transducer with metallopeptidase domain
MSVAAIAAIHYSKEVTTSLTQALALLLWFIASLVVLLLFIFTLLHAFVWKSLFPNDTAIAITATKHNRNKVRMSKQSSSNSHGAIAATAADKELLNPSVLVNMDTEFRIKGKGCSPHIKKMSSLAPSLNPSAVFEVGR